MKMRVTTPDDIRYVRDNYYTLEELCTRAGLPKASYVLRDGTQFFPADYFAQRFTREDFIAAGLCDEDYAGFLEGTYGICLHEVTPQNIARKTALIARISALIESPDEEKDSWRTALRNAVDELDALERQFTQFDREHFGRPVSRDTYITAVRQMYLGVKNCVPGY